MSGGAAQADFAFVRGWGSALAGGGVIGWGLVNKRAFWLGTVGALDLRSSLSSNALSLKSHIVLI